MNKPKCQECGHTHFDHETNGTAVRCRVTECSCFDYRPAPEPAADVPRDRFKSVNEGMDTVRLADLADRIAENVKHVYFIPTVPEDAPFKVRADQIIMDAQEMKALCTKRSEV